MCRKGENIYKRKDGRYEGRYIKGRNEAGKPVYGYIYGMNYREVRAQVAEERVKLEQMSGNRILLRRWLEKWMDCSTDIALKPSTMQTYRYAVERYIVPCLGTYFLDEIGADELQKLLKNLNDRGLAVGTIRRIMATLSVALEAARNAGHIGVNCCRGLYMGIADKPDQRFLTQEEEGRIVQIALDQGYVPVLIGLFMGLRVGEVCGLKWSDVDWGTCTIRINRTVQRVNQRFLSRERLDQGGETDGHKTTLVAMPPKSQRSKRTIPIPSIILSRLEEMRGRSTSDYIFGRKGKASTAERLERMIGRTAAAAGVQGVHFHTLRHTFATRLIEAGRDPKTVSDLMGHGSVATTLDIYVHMKLEEKREAIDDIVKGFIE